MGSWNLPFYLAIKEVLHNKLRYLLIALIVALITVLVLFIAALAEGLGGGNREYIEKLNGQIVVYQAGSNLSIGASRIGRSSIAEMRRVPGVADVGQVGASVATVELAGNPDGLKVSLLGVEPGRPGEPPVLQGTTLGRARSDEAVIDANLAERSGIRVGDEITIRTTQGTDEEEYKLRVVGQSDGRSYSLQPSLFVPLLTYDKVRPKSADEGSDGELVSNVAVVRVQPNADVATVIQEIEAQVQNTQAADIVTAYENTPGYAAQQNTLSTQQYFTLLIGVLVIGGFFQIQTLQKVAQIGMLKAIGASNTTVSVAASFQVIALNALGVAFGVLGTLALISVFPATIPIRLTGSAVVTAVTLLLLIGPLGGLVSVIALVRIEPLRALGLAQ